MTKAQHLTYTMIAKELKVTTAKFQQFVIEERSRRGKVLKPDATVPGVRQHLFSRRMADALKKAFVAQRIEKVWKKAE